MRIKRLTLVTILLVFSLITTASAETFSDVPESHPYKEAIDFCYEKGFVLGTSGTTFTPDSNLTRAQLAIIWCRTLNVKDTNHSFTDITRLKNYYDEAVIIMHGLGTLKGTSATKFSPEDFVSREQLATLAMRTYKLGVANKDDYMRYADHASISEWARDGVSSCINAGVFEGLYDKENFMPDKPVTRAEICKLIYNISLPEYDITIGTLEGGTIAADRTKARPGTLITLTITPDAGMQLKEGTLKYNDIDITGDTFTMPAEDVTITAEFEDKLLESIEVTSGPTKSTYTVNEALDLSGLVITAIYSDSSKAAISGYTTTPASGDTLDTEGTVEVKVSYTEGDITKNATFEVQVNPA